MTQADKDRLMRSITESSWEIDRLAAESLKLAKRARMFAVAAVVCGIVAIVCALINLFSKL